MNTLSNIIGPAPQEASIPFIKISHCALRKKNMIMNRIIYFFILISALFTLPAHAGEYQLGIGDVVHITVYDHPDLLVNEVQVDEDGKIAMPLIGVIDDMIIVPLVLHWLLQRLPEQLHALFRHASRSPGITPTRFRDSI